MTDLQFDEWIAYPDRRAFVTSKDSEKYANTRGWWRTDWVGNEDAVAQRIASGSVSNDLPPELQLDD